jgi:hypothetical protein
MNTFKLDPEGFNEARLKILNISIPSVVLAMIAGIFIASVNQEG